MSSCAAMQALGAGLSSARMAPALSAAHVCLAAGSGGGWRGALSEAAAGLPYVRARGGRHGAEVRVPYPCPTHDGATAAAAAAAGGPAAADAVAAAAGAAAAGVDAFGGGSQSSLADGLLHSYAATWLSMLDVQRLGAGAGSTSGGAHVSTGAAAMRKPLARPHWDEASFGKHHPICHATHIQNRVDTIHDTHMYAYLDN